MRRLLATFLALLVLLPSLACAMPACAMSQQLGSSMPCHDQIDSDQTSLDALMILQDCMGVDFQVAENLPDLGAHEKSKNTLDPNTAIVEKNYAFSLAAQPPLGALAFRPNPFHFEPAIILTTQRFRI